MATELGRKEADFRLSPLTEFLGQRVTFKANRLARLRASYSKCGPDSPHIDTTVNLSQSLSVRRL